MHRCFGPIVAPLLDGLEPVEIVETGAGAGHLTARLLSSRAARIDAIDPAPRLPRDLIERAGERLRVHAARSVEVLPLLGPVDLALLDGDPNWHTVHGDLTALVETARREGRAAPVVLVHHVHWPYGRRDGYYDPASLPETASREPVAAGLLPGLREPVPDGLRLVPYCARVDLTDRSGVLTAVEDFLDEDPGDWTVIDVPGFHGVGILAEAGRVRNRPALSAVLRELGGRRTLARQARRAEVQRIAAEVRIARLASALGPVAAAEAEATTTAVDDWDAALAAAEARHRETLAELAEAHEAAEAARAALAQERAAVREGEPGERPPGGASPSELADHRAQREALAWRLERVEDDLRERREELRDAVTARDREHRTAVEAAVRLEHASAGREAEERRRRELEQRLATAERGLREVADREAAERGRAELLAGRLAHREEALEAEQRTARRLDAELRAERERTTALLERDARVGEHLERVLASRSWRLSHGAARALRRLTRRRRRDSALDIARAELARGAPLPLEVESPSRVERDDILH